MMPLGAPSIPKYGSLVRPDTQIVALRTHCPLCSWLETTTKQIALGYSTNQNVVARKRNHHKHDPLSLYNQHTIIKH